MGLSFMSHHIRFHSAISSLSAVLALAACDVQASSTHSESSGDVATGRGWSPSSSPTIAGVPAEAVRAALALRLQGVRIGILPSDTWRHVRGLYQVEGGAPLFLTASGVDKRRARAVIDAVSAAGDHGIRLDAYPLDAVQRALARLHATRHPTADQLADADVTLAALYASLGEDLLTGQISPSSVAQSWHMNPGEDRVDSTLVRAVRASDFSSSLDSLRPLDAGYDSLRHELAHYRAIVSNGGWPLVPTGKALAPGDSGPASRLMALQERLRIEGMIGGDKAVPLDSSTKGRARYDSALAGAVARFQMRHSIAVDSVLGNETIVSLNIPAEYRLGQIAANLERYRWLPRALGSRYILVNVPAFQLHAFDNGQEAFSMKVIVGADYEDRATPVFSDSMEYVVFRPYWMVPDSIAAKEIWPKVAQSRDYLARNDYETFTEHGEQRVRQKPGDKNALGLVKFIFPNDFNIYLHDTPESELFNKDVRAFSHGCIRVEHPDQLAEFVLGWPADSVQRAMHDGRDNRTVKLTQKIPVYILYLTSYVRGGELYFGNDLYDRDEALVSALGGGNEPTAAEIEELNAIRKLI